MARTKIKYTKFQRAITQNLLSLELWFLSTALPLIHNISTYEILSLYI